MSKLDTEEQPPSTNNSTNRAISKSNNVKNLETSFKNRVQKFLNKLFSTYGSAPHKKENVFDEKHAALSKIEESLTIRDFESFAKKTVRDVMIPRSDIVAVNHDISLVELSKVIIKNAHTRTLVYKDNLDNVIGFVHIKDLFEIIAKSKKYNLKKLTRKHLICPDSMKLMDLLQEMQLKRIHIAVAVDEYGGTDGIITIEDIIEAIVGRIDDEHDTDLQEENFKILKPGIVIVNARMEVEELEKILNVKLKQEDDEFDTIGGLILAKTGTVPEKGEIIDVADDVTIEVVDSTPRILKQLKVVCSKYTETE